LSNFNQAAIRISGITLMPSENCIPSLKVFVIAVLF